MQILHRRFANGQQVFFKCLTLLNFREMKMKNTVRYHSKHTKIAKNFFKWQCKMLGGIWSN